MARQGARLARTIIDISTMADWIGPSVGIVRVERGLATRARTHRSDVVFAVFDPLRQGFREVLPAWAGLIVSGEAVMDPWAFSAARSSRRRRSDRIPQPIRPLANALLRSRRTLLLSLERLRVQRLGSRLAGMLDAIQRCFMSKKYYRYMVAPDGRRRAIIPYDLALGDEIAWRSESVLVCASPIWDGHKVRVLREITQQAGVRLVLFVHDVIPVLLPEIYPRDQVERFDGFVRAVFPLADLMIFSTRIGERDALAYCAANQVASRKVCVVPLGVDALPEPTAELPLPQGIEAGRYALFVSTIEPRKGHRMLYDVWLALLAEGVPQQTGFKLIFVGRAEGAARAFANALQRDLRLGDTLKLLQGVEDNELHGLYARAAFCLFPSKYEGYGLPAVEAFAHGKPIIASTGGALPEIVGDLSPCIDPDDAAAWHAMLKDWIFRPELRRPYEEAIKSRFRHPDWDEAASRFFATIDQELTGAASD